MSTTIKTLISILGVAFLLSSPFAGAEVRPTVRALHEQSPAFSKADTVKACKEKCKKGDDACVKKCDEPKKQETKK